MNPPPQAPGGWRRLAAMAAIALPVVVIVWTGAIVVSNVGRVVVQLALFAIATFAAWYTLTRVGVRRLIAAVIAVAAIVGVLVAGYFDDAGLPRWWFGSCCSCWPWRSLGSRWVAISER